MKAIDQQPIPLRTACDPIPTEDGRFPSGNKCPYGAFWIAVQFDVEDSLERIHLRLDDRFSQVQGSPPDDAAYFPARRRVV